MTSSFSEPLAIPPASGARFHLLVGSCVFLSKKLSGGGVWCCFIGLFFTLSERKQKTKYLIPLSIMEFILFVKLGTFLLNNLSCWFQCPNHHSESLFSPVCSLGLSPSWIPLPSFISWRMEGFLAGLSFYFSIQVKVLLQTGS